MYFISLKPNLYDHVSRFQLNKRGYQDKIWHFHFLRGWFWWFCSWNFTIIHLQNSKNLSNLIGMLFIFLKPNLYDSCKSFPAKQKRIWGENLTFPFSQRVILAILQLQFHYFSPTEHKKSIKIGSDAFHFPQTKLIRPCMSVPAKQNVTLAAEQIHIFHVIVCPRVKYRYFLTPTGPLLPYGNKKNLKTEWRSKKLFLHNFDLLHS